MLQFRFQAQQGIEQEEVQVLLADLLKGVGLYFDRRNLINIFGMVRKENTTAKTVRKGVIGIGINDNGAWEAEGYFFRRGIRRYHVLQREVQIIGDHTQNHPQNHPSVIMHLTFQVIVVGIRYQQSDIHQI